MAPDHSPLGDVPEFERFVSIIAALRGPDGCPWDAEQTHESLSKNMIEEAYEAVHEIETHNIAGLREELGDVLLQVVLHAQIAAEAGEFTIDDVVKDISAKIVRRHPHVFDTESVTTSTETVALWDKIKRQEKSESRSGILDSIPNALPALMLAADISRKAVSAGFEWESLDGVIEKLEEEVQEFCAADPGSAHAAEELGDILFTVVNLGRKHGIDAETALRGTCNKFRRRWSFMEERAKCDGLEMTDYTLAQLEEGWQQAKAALQENIYTEER